MSTNLSQSDSLTKTGQDGMEQPQTAQDAYKTAALHSNPQAVSSGKSQDEPIEELTSSLFLENLETVWKEQLKEVEKSVDFKYEQGLISNKKVMVDEQELGQSSVPPTESDIANIVLPLPSIPSRVSEIHSMSNSRLEVSAATKSPESVIEESLPSPPASPVSLSSSEFEPRKLWSFEEWIQSNWSPSWVDVGIRAISRTATYCFYDFLSLYGYRDLGRIGKILVEASVDEICPSTVGSIWRKFYEYLLPCGISSIVLWTYIRRMRGESKKKTHVGLMLFRFLYRIARQAVIYRLFFPVGSKPYWLVTIIAIICAFFREECIWDIYRIHMWPSHFNLAQGKRAVLQSVAYWLAFSIPLTSVSSVFKVRYRRANMKKLVFFSSWILGSRIHERVQDLLSTSYEKIPKVAIA